MSWAIGQWMLGYFEQLVHYLWQTRTRLNLWLTEEVKGSVKLNTGVYRLVGGARTRKVLGPAAKDLNADKREH